MERFQPNVIDGEQRFNRRSSSITASSQNPSTPQLADNHTKFGERRTSSASRRH